VEVGVVEGGDLLQQLEVGLALLLRARALEDEGFFCLDNLPVSLFATFIELVGKSDDSVRDVALVMDIRGRDFLKGYERVFREITEDGNVVEILFFDATDEVLIRRFSETRRRHPALDTGSVPEGIRFERRMFHASFATEGQKEGMTAFVEKRPASYGYGRNSTSPFRQ
jgi:RNase adaptor protein for sRNA GlmZ degradation